MKRISKLKLKSKRRFAINLKERDLIERIHSCIYCADEGFQGIPSSLHCPKCSNNVCESHSQPNSGALCIKCYKE